MTNRNHQYSRGRSHERSPLRSQDSPTSYGALDPSPHPPGLEPLPSDESTPFHPSDEHQETETHVYKPRGDPLPLRLTRITKAHFSSFVVFLVILAQVVAFIFLCSKIGGISKATALMREQRGAMEEEAKHLESERLALRGESDRLEKERQELESSTLKMRREKDELESAIRRSEQERSKLEQEKHQLEDKRQSLEHEKEELREERERWEKAREDRVPQDAFWEAVEPAPDCRAYGKREYSGTLQNTPGDWTDLDACMNMPVEIKGVTLRRPNQCAYDEASPRNVHGFWMVDWDQPDCKPWHQDITDTGCTNPGSGIRRIQAQVMGINNKSEQDWRVLCETTPFTWHHVTYNSPTHCEEGWFGRKWATWDVPDESC